MGSSKKGGKTEVTDYLMTLHYGVALGPVDSIKRIKIADKDLGIAEVTENTRIGIDNMNLFGGPKKGGGLRGTLHFLLGGGTQKLTDYLAAKMGRGADTITGYRGITSIFFTGPTSGAVDPETGEEIVSGPLTGFTWGTNNPYIPEVEITAQRKPKSLDLDSMIGDDANPAHIIAECLTSSTFGPRYLPEQINQDSFLYAAQVFRDESFGLSLRWTGSTPSEDFINDVLRHANANLSFDFVENQWFLTPLRGDYEVANLNYYGPDQVGLNSFQRRAWGETINQVTVKWRNPENEKDETVVVQDLSGFEIQGRSITDNSGTYEGIRNRELALKAAERDLRQASAPLSSVEIEVSAAELRDKVGDVVIFEWYESDSQFKVKPTVMRVVKIEKGGRGAASRKVFLVEDIYSFGVSVTSASVDQAASISQEPIDISLFRIGSAPYFMAANVLGDTQAQSTEYPAVGAFILASSGLVDIRDIDVESELPMPEQSPEYQYVETVDEADTFTLLAGLSIETDSVMSLPTSYTRRGLTVGGFVIIASGTAEEICVITSISADSVTLKRGVLDTVPQSWPSGARAWIISRNFTGYDTTERFAGETAKYKLLPITSRGRLPRGDATERTALLSERPHLPHRPANIEVDGQGIPSASVSTMTPFEVSWSNRNRVTETSQILNWTDGSTTPEDGQLTQVVVRRGGTVLATETTDLDTLTLDTASWGLSSGDVLAVSLSAVRDGFSSWQEAVITVTIT